jgi:hypothetical protein
LIDRRGQSVRVNFATIVRIALRVQDVPVPPDGWSFGANCNLILWRWDLIARTGAGVRSQQLVAGGPIILDAAD